MQIIYDLIASSWFLNTVTLLFCMAIVGAYVFYRKDLKTLNKNFFRFVSRARSVWYRNISKGS